MPRIVPYEPGMCGDLTRLVNLHLAQVPSGLALSERQVAAALAEEPFWDRHYDDERDGRVPREEIVCVVEGGRLVGAAEERWYERGAAIAAGLGPEWAATEEFVLVQWLVAVPDDPETARYLVQGLVKRADATRRGVRIAGRFRFGIGWGGVADAWPHLTAALSASGFSVNQRWTMFHMATDEGLHPPPPAGFTFRWHIDELRLEWELLAFAAGVDGVVEEVVAGECQVWDVPHGARSAGRHLWTTVEWLGVEQPHRRRGLGTYLLLEQRRVQATRGVGHLLLWAEPDDPDSAAAIRLYDRLGFQRGPTLLKLERPFR